MTKPMGEAAAARVVDKQERQTNLVLLLLNTEVPLSLSRLRADVPGYGGGAVAVRQKFERDKRELRTSGIEILSVPIDTEDQVGYRIDPSTFWLPDLGLDDDEARALGLAAATLGFGGDGVSRVLLDAPPPVPSGTLASLPALPYLYRAIAERCAVSFTHKAKQRRVAPGTLTRHGDRWYLGAVDLDKDAVRHFRVDRISGVPKLEAPGSGRLDDARIDELRDARPWELRRDAPSVTVRVDAAIARAVLAELEGDATTEVRPDGSVDVSVGWLLPGLARSWVMTLGHHAEVLAPARVREEVIAWLQSIVAAPRTEPGPITWRTPPETQVATPSASQRLLAVLTTLAQQQTTTLTALSMRFGLTRDQMRTVLLEAACMGVPPFLHGDLLDIHVPLDDAEGDVVTWIDTGLFRPQLTWRDAFELDASARAALNLTGADDRGPLARALAKLEAVTGGHVDLDIDTPAALGIVEDAVGRRRQLIITYYSASSDSVCDRRIDPVAVRERAGHYYVLAWCHLAVGWRTFRVDRIEAAQEVGERSHVETPPPFDDVFGFADAERVDIALSDAASWLAEGVGVERAGHLGDGRVVVRLRVASTTYLSRLLLQAGPEAEVLAPESLRGVGAAAAATVLARYEASQPH